jgi:hypothetical protein
MKGIGMMSQSLGSAKVRGATILQRRCAQKIVLTPR